jgi:Fe-S-cluster containining protein
MVPGMTPPPTPLEQYQALVLSVDAFFTRVTERHRAEVCCRAGCDGCCRASPSLCPVEAEAFDRWLVRLDVALRARLVRRAVDDRPNRCVALAENGHCAIHPARPLICRVHGIPIRRLGHDGVPFVVACSDNFTAGLPGADDTFDLEAASAALRQLDQAFLPDETFAEPHQEQLRVILLRRGD